MSAAKAEAPAHLRDPHASRRRAGHRCARARGRPPAQQGDRPLRARGLGAPLALELARSGCRRLHLIDHDIVEPGNAVRYPLGASAWGRHKAAVLAGFIAREYPRTEPVAHIHNIGVPGGERLPGDDELLARVLDGADLAVDATASYGVTAVIADHCRDRDLPLIALFASPDVTSGIVARYGPDEGCPTCLEFAWHRQAIARPPGLGSEAGFQQPPGCAELTFTGASYELQELSLQAMRLMVDTLAAPAEARPSLVCTLSLAGAAGRIPPRWHVDHLPRDPDYSCGPEAGRRWPSACSHPHSRQGLHPAFSVRLLRIAQVAHNLSDFCLLAFQLGRFVETSLTVQESGSTRNACPSS